MSSILMIIPTNPVKRVSNLVLQVIVQRALAARNMANAQGATLLAGFLKLSPLFLIIIPGMISRVLYTGKISVTLTTT
jgi:uncharacterized sodium:solute symporter family permease YidK